MTLKSAPTELPNASTVGLDEASVSLYHSSGRRVRSERVEAACIVMGVFLRHLDPGTLYVGQWSPQGDFIPLDMGTIASEAGLCRRRCERAIVYLKQLGFVAIFPPQHIIILSPMSGYGCLGWSLRLSLKGPG